MAAAHTELVSDSSVSMMHGCIYWICGDHISREVYISF